MEFDLFLIGEFPAIFDSWDLIGSLLLEPHRLLIAEASRFVDCWDFIGFNRWNRIVSIAVILCVFLVVGISAVVGRWNPVGFLIVRVASVSGWWNHGGSLLLEPDLSVILGVLFFGFLASGRFVVGC